MQAIARAEGSPETLGPSSARMPAAKPASVNGRENRASHRATNVESVLCTRTFLNYLKCKPTASGWAEENEAGSHGLRAPAMRSKTLK